MSLWGQASMGHITFLLEMSSTSSAGHDSCTPFKMLAEAPLSNSPCPGAPLGYLWIPASNLPSLAGQVGQILSAALSLAPRGMQGALGVGSE